MKSNGYGTNENSKGTRSTPVMPAMASELRQGVKHLEKNLHEKDRDLERSKMKGDVRSA